MTPEDFEKIALWMGWEKQDTPDRGPEWWKKDADGDEFCGYASTKTFLTPAECYEALNRLVEKGYEWEMHGRDGQCECLISKQREDGSMVWIVEEDYPTIPAAVEQAILKLAKREG